MKKSDLVIESGSSKTDWYWVDSKKPAGHTAGLNPYVQGMQEIQRQLSLEIPLILKDIIPNHIHFYGSGFSSEEFNHPMKKLLEQLTGCKKAIVEHDLLGAARAAWGSDSGLVAILGTGSNSCFYDGKKIVSQQGGHGYLFGDEGSGADMGKRCIKALLDNEMPEELSQDLLRQAQVQTPVELRNLIHGQPSPNVKLAALALWVAEKKQHPYIQNIIQVSFSTFIQKTILRFPEKQPVVFIGSIASSFEEELKLILMENNIPLHEIITQPVLRLLSYHEKNNSFD